MYANECMNCRLGKDEHKNTAWPKVLFIDEKGEIDRAAVFTAFAKDDVYFTSVVKHKPRNKMCARFLMNEINRAGAPIIVVFGERVFHLLFPERDFAPGEYFIWEKRFVIATPPESFAATLKTVRKDARAERRFIHRNIHLKLELRQIIYEPLSVD